MLDDRTDETVYRSHAAELVRFATGLVGPSDAADVVAEAFLRVSGSPAWERAVDRRALWYQAVVFQSTSWKRSAARRRAREHLVVNAQARVSSPTEIDHDVELALDTLSAQQRAVIVLTYWGDLLPAGIAELLGVSEGTVRKQLARGRRKLKGALSHG